MQSKDDINSRGTTLVEVIVSVLIISIVAAGVFGAFLGSQSFFKRSMHRIQAFNFARAAMEKLRSNYTYEDIGMEHIVQEEIVTDAHFIELGLGNIITGEMEDLGTELSYNVSEMEHGGYRVVTVRVTWDEPGF